jgi:Glycosyl transferase family 2
MPLVSIITPTFNRAELLPTIWECVRAQSFSDFEWLVLDRSRRRYSTRLATHASATCMCRIA